MLMPIAGCSFIFSFFFSSSLLRSEKWRWIQNRFGNVMMRNQSQFTWAQQLNGSHENEMNVCITQCLDVGISQCEMLVARDEINEWTLISHNSSYFMMHGGHITITHWPLSNKNWLEFHFNVGVRPLPLGLRQRLNVIKQLQIIIIYTWKWI